MTKTRIIGAVVIFLAIFVGYSLAASFLYPDMPSRGQFGDTFGGLNTFFSGLAFLGVIYAILLQSEELGLQRKELALTRKELERTAKAQEKSEKALAKQAESLKVTAKLNGLSAILQHQGTLMEVIAIGKYGESGVHRDLKAKSDEIITNIEDIIKEK